MKNSFRILLVVLTTALALPSVVKILKKKPKPRSI